MVDRGGILELFGGASAASTTVSAGGTLIFGLAIR